VTKVTAHSTAEGWITVANPGDPMTIDLLQLKTSADALGLGAIDVQEGKITQIRLYVTAEGNWVHLTGTGADAHVPLVVPSGVQSGIKIVGQFDVVACSSTAVTLDFDGEHSIQTHPTGHDDQWILRPVVRVKEAVTTPVGCADTSTGGDGSSCDAATPCPAGQVCSSGTCTTGATVPAGGSCSVDEECLSASCAAQICAVGGPGSPCQASADCTTGVCDGGTCGGGSPAGATCDTNDDCASHECSGTCQPGNLGDPCSVDPDCQEGLMCDQGLCAGLPPPVEQG
jgi:hypothetical protein